MASRPTIDGKNITPMPDHSNRVAIGRHLLADFHGINPTLLRDESQLMKLLKDALSASGFHQLAEHSHKFPGAGGVTGFVLLSESHAAFHSYPEYEYLAVDVFSCGMADPEPVMEYLNRQLEPQEVTMTVKTRGSYNDAD